MTRLRRLFAAFRGINSEPLGGRVYTLEEVDGPAWHPTPEFMEKYPDWTPERGSDAFFEDSLRGFSGRLRGMNLPPHLRPGEAFEIPHLHRRDGSECCKITRHVVGSGPVPQICAHCGERFDEAGVPPIEPRACPFCGGAMDLGAVACGACLRQAADEDPVEPGEIAAKGPR